MERRTKENKIEPEEKAVSSKGNGKRTKNDREQEGKPGIARKSSTATLSESETGTAFGLSSGNGRSESPRSSRRSPRTKQDIAGLREIYTLEFRKGDLPRKFIMHLPEEIKAGELIENIGGEAMSVRVPGDTSPFQYATLHKNSTTHILYEWCFWFDHQMTYPINDVQIFSLIIILMIVYVIPTDDIRPGEKVILVASYPPKEEIKGTERQEKVCDIACASPMSSSCKQS